MRLYSGTRTRPRPWRSCGSGSGWIRGAVEVLRRRRRQPPGHQAGRPDGLHHYQGSAPGGAAEGAQRKPAGERPGQRGQSSAAVQERIKGAVALIPNAGNLVKDLETLAYQENGHGGRLDKSDPGRTHASDALGYYIAKRFPIRNKARGYRF